MTFACYQKISTLCHVAAVSAGRVSKIQFLNFLKRTTLPFYRVFYSYEITNCNRLSRHSVFAQVHYISCSTWLYFVSPIFFRQWIWNNVIDVFVFSFSITYLFLQINNISFFKSQPWGFPFSWENQENVSRFSNGIIPKEQMPESHHFLETMVSAVCYRKNIVTNLILFRF